MTVTSRRWLRCVWCGLLAAAWIVAGSGCGLMLRGPHSDCVQCAPRPVKQLRALRRERQLEQELQKESFPRAEQVGIAPPKDAKSSERQSAEN